MPDFTKFTTRVTNPYPDGSGNYEMGPGEPISINLAAVTALEQVGVTAPTGVKPKGPGTRIWVAGGQHFDVTAPYADVVTLSEGGKLASKPPVVAIQTPPQTWMGGDAISFALPPGTFTDPQGEEFALTTGPLPTWLSFDATAATFSGTAPLTAEAFSVEVIATNTGGATVSESIAVTVVEKPVVAA